MAKLKRAHHRAQQKLTALYDLLASSEGHRGLKEFHGEFNQLLLTTALRYFAPHQQGKAVRDIQAKKDMEIFLKRFEEQEDDF